MKPKSIFEAIGGGLLIAWILTRGHGAEAHQPGILEAGETYEVEDPILSAALYGTFERGTEVFEIRMRLDAPLAIPNEVLVPHRDPLKNHRPVFAIVGTGLPEPSAADLAILPRALPDGAGAMVVRNDVPERDIVFESILRRVYWSNGVVAHVLPAGDVRIWIWSPKETSGDFVLGYGVEEGGQDLGHILSNWGTYAY
jgi:hypothetical protein